MIFFGHDFIFIEGVLFDDNGEVPNVCLLLPLLSTD